MRHRWLLSMAALLTATACGTAESAQPTRADGTRDSLATTLHVTILGDSGDSRVPAVREALEHWNETAVRLRLRVRFDSGTVVRRPLPEDALEATGRSMPWRVIGALRLRTALEGVPGDVVIALSRRELISFGVTTGTGRVGVIGLRPDDRLPLSLPNTTRNVVAHELGHLLGLQHNADSTTLMCGRPARCRPAAFASKRSYFFPLTASDEQALLERWRE